MSKNVALKIPVKRLAVAILGIVILMIGLITFILGTNPAVDNCPEIIKGGIIMALQKFSQLAMTQVEK